MGMGMGMGMGMPGGFGGFDPSAVKLKKANTRGPSSSPSVSSGMGMGGFNPAAVKLRKTSENKGTSNPTPSQAKGPPLRTVSVPSFKGGLQEGKKTEKKMSLRERILDWTKRRLAPYSIKITNFKNDWADGIAYCALIHSFERGKELIGDFDSLKSSEAEKNLELAFSAAEKLGAPRLLDVEDFPHNGGVVEPLSNITFLSELYNKLR
mmetsp:Transcript_40996/g.57017  ORF Transcript_40996/g.57017 Transcript_40996/m.57017 type:complete len:208 (-) Transcript_40996:109-732(-)